MACEEAEMNNIEGAVRSADADALQGVGDAVDVAGSAEAVRDRTTFFNKPTIARKKVHTKYSKRVSLKMCRI